MHDTILVVAQPSFWFFVLDELDNFPDELVEDGFIFRGINNGELDPTHVCTGHANVFHCVEPPDSFDDRSD